MKCLILQDPKADKFVACIPVVARPNGPNKYQSTNKVAILESPHL